MILILITVRLGYNYEKAFHFNHFIKINNQIVTLHYT